jgi:hypothetical protein
MSADTRRRFLGKLLAGGTVVLMPAVFAGCDDDDRRTIVGPDPAPVTGLSFDLRTDVGIFRLVHTLEHLEAAFYTAVVGSAAFGSFSAAEREVFVDIRDAEVIHREFLTAALGSQAVPDLRGSIDMTRLNSILASRDSILSASKLFEHLGVAGLNGAGKYLQDARNLLLAGKFASVEARHAAALLDISPTAGVNPNTAFAGDHVIDNNGPFLSATTNLDVLLLATQAFEDTGVRAYKGQAGRLLINGNNAADTALESALRIHSVEARHASKIRRIRRQRNPNDTVLRFSGYVRGGGAAAAGTAGITNPPAEVVAALNLIYGGANGPISFPESNTRHVFFNGTTEVSVDAALLPRLELIGDAAARTAAATQAFDEALTKEEVTTIVRNFIKDDPARGLP